MALKFRMENLSPAEASLIAWQFGFDEDDDPFLPTLWQTIAKAWAVDVAGKGTVQHLKRLGTAHAYPEEVAVYRKFKSADGESYWLDMLQRAGLNDRRQRSGPAPAVERRRRQS